MAIFVNAGEKEVKRANFGSNVATSARDLPSIIKSSKGLEFEGIERRTNEGTEFQSSSDTDFEEVPEICIVTHFWILE